MTFALYDLAINPSNFLMAQSCYAIPKPLVPIIGSFSILLWLLVLVRKLPRLFERLK